MCCDQHCWSTHTRTRTHTHTPIETLPGCVVIFLFCSLSPPAAAAAALHIARTCYNCVCVFQFLLCFFLPFPSLCLHTLPSCCWLSSLVRNVIKFLLVQQHSTLFSSLLQLPLPQLLLFPLSSLAFGLRYLPPPVPLPLDCPVHFTRLNTNCAQRGMFTVVKRWTHCDSLSSRTAAR